MGESLTAMGHEIPCVPQMVISTPRVGMKQESALNTLCKLCENRSHLDQGDAPQKATLIPAPHEETLNITEVTISPEHTTWGGGGGGQPHPHPLLATVMTGRVSAHSAGIEY